MTKDDLNQIKEFLRNQKIPLQNTRAFKVGERYLITVGSVSTDGSRVVEFCGKTFELRYGEFASYLEDVVYNL
jgi:hypothetical protein